MVYDQGFLSFILDSAEEVCKRCCASGRHCPSCVLSVLSPSMLRLRLDPIDRDMYMLRASVGPLAIVSGNNAPWIYCHKSI